MSTIRELYEADCKTISIRKKWQFLDQSSSQAHEIDAKIACDFLGNAKYWYFFIPNSTDIVSTIMSLPENEQLRKCELTSTGDGVSIEIKEPYGTMPTQSSQLRFTHRIHLFVDAELSEDARAFVSKHYDQKGFFLVLKERNFAAEVTKQEQPLAFISHDSRDKPDLVKPLFEELVKYPLFPVWYDEFSLEIGDSLRESIEKGLKSAKRCILCLSPNFLSNTGWGRTEFNSIFTREIVESDRVILPIWHNVSVEDVYDYCPTMADRVGLQSSLGPEELARQIFLKISSDNL